MKKDQDEFVESEAKRIKLDYCKEERSLGSAKANLLDFSDDVLLIIFASLNPEDLLSISE